MRKWMLKRNPLAGLDKLPPKMEKILVKRVRAFGPKFRRLRR